MAYIMPLERGRRLVVFENILDGVCGPGYLRRTGLALRGPHCAVYLISISYTLTADSTRRRRSKTEKGHDEAVQSKRFREQEEIPHSHITQEPPTRIPQFDKCVRDIASRWVLHVSATLDQTRDSLMLKPKLGREIAAEGSLRRVILQRVHGGHGGVVGHGCGLMQ